MTLDARHGVRARSVTTRSNAKYSYRTHSKRIFDVALVVLLFLVLCPLLLVLTVVVSTTSRGHAFYRQRRVGLDGREFMLLKYRSMYVGAHLDQAKFGGLNGRDDGPLFKIVHDPRVTGVGKWMRKYSLDELPQMVNVLLGSMSLVGPRPALPNEVVAYPERMRRRLGVKPGLTGLWQVSGRSDLSWDRSVALDLEYVDNCSLALDLRIMVRTLPAVVAARGAY